MHIITKLFQMDTKLKHFKFIPFTKENFDEKFWYQTRRNISMTGSSYQDKGLSAYKTLSKLLVEFNTYDEINKCFDQSSIRDFFFEKLFPCVAKSILSCKTFQSKNHEKLLNDCLRQMLQIWLRTLPNYSPGLFRMVQLILNPAQAYYRFATSKQNKNKVIKDSDKKKKYAIIKPKYCNSEFFVDLLNYFGEIGGFDKIFNILIDKICVISGIMVCELCSIIGNLTSLLAIDSKFYQAICSNLEKESRIEISERPPKNFKAILKGCHKFVKQMSSDNDKKMKIMDKIREIIYKNAFPQIRMLIKSKNNFDFHFTSEDETQKDFYSLIDPVELNKLFAKCLRYSESQSKVFWIIIQNHYGYKDIHNLVFNYFFILMKNRYSHDYFKRIIKECLKNWQKNIFNCLELVILKECVCSLNTNDYIGGFWQLRKDFEDQECKSYLIKEKGCHLLILNYFKNLKSTLKAKSPDLEDIDCELLDSYLPNKSISYSDQISLGLTVLKELTDETWVTSDFLNELWTLFIEDGLTRKEGMLLLQFLSHCFSSDSLSITKLKFLEEKVQFITSTSYMEETNQKSVTYFVKFVLEMYLKSSQFNRNYPNKDTLTSIAVQKFQAYVTYIAVQKIKDYVTYLCQERLLGLLINYLKHLKANFKQKYVGLYKQGITKEDTLGWISHKINSFKSSASEGITLIGQLFVKNIVRFKCLEEVLILREIFIDDAIIPNEADLLIKLLDDLLRSEVLENDDQKEKNRVFFKIVFSFLHSEYLFEKYATKFRDFFSFFWLKVNCDMTIPYSFGYSSQISQFFFITALPHQLQGYDLLWRFLCKDKVKNFTNDQNQINAFNTLVQIYTCFSYRLQPEIQNIRKDCLEKCFKYIKESLSSDKQVSILEPNCVITILKLLNRIMDVSEIKGTRCFKTCSQLGRSVAFKLCIKNKAKCSDSNVLGEIMINVRSNHTVYDIFRVIAKEFRVEWDEITLYKSSFANSEALDAPWSKTLLQLGITSFKTFTARLNDQSRKELFSKDEKRIDDSIMNRLLIRVIEEYSENGMLTPENILAFMRLYADNYQRADHRNINQIFSDFDKDRDSYLSSNEFQNYLLDVRKFDRSNFSTILQKINFRSDGRSLNEVNNGTIDFKSQFSYLISSNDKYFKLLFSLLEQENDQIAEEAWILLDRLPPCPLVFTQMVELKEIREITDPQQRDWNKLLDLNHKYKLLYSLKIVEYLLSDAISDIKNYDNSLTNDTDDKMLQCLKDPKLRAYIEIWYVDFIKFGGFDHLCGIFMLLPDTELVTEFAKGIASFLKAIKEESIKLSNLVSLQEVSNKSVEKFLHLAMQNKKKYQATLNMHKHLK